MQTLFLQTALMVSLGAIVYLMAIAVPRAEKDRHDLAEQNVISVPLDKMDAFLEKLRDKTLRRLKLAVLKADNFISRKLNKEEKKL